MRFGSDELQNELKSAIKAINQRAERARLTAAYKKADLLFASAKAKEDYLKAAEAFDGIGDFEDAKQRAADIEKQNRARARANAIQAGANAMKEKLPLIKKVALVVVPVLVVAILAAAILPRIDFSKPKDNGDSVEGMTSAATIPATSGTVTSLERK